jgi:hypothetical protein
MIRMPLKGQQKWRACPLDAIFQIMSSLLDLEMISFLETEKEKEKKM